MFLGGMNIEMRIFQLAKIKNLSIYFVASVITAVIGLIVNPFLAQGLSHEDYAIIGYYSSFGTLLLPIVSFSLQSYYARNYFLIDENKREMMLQNLFSVFAVISVFAFILFFVFYYWYHINYVRSITFSPYALLSFLPMYFSCYYNLYLMDLRMQNKSKKYAWITIVQSTIGAILSLLLVYIIHWGALGRLLALLIVSVMFSIYSIISIHFHFTWNWSIIKPALIFCFPLCISGILSFFFLGIDRPMLAKLENNHDLGLYNVGLQISAYLAIFGTVLLQTFDPDLYKYTSLKQHKKVVLLVLGITGLCLLPNLCFILISKPIISILTAGRYVDAADFANILCLKNVSTTFAFIMSGVLIGYGFSNYELLNRFLGSIVSFALYKILIDKWAFYGAAWGQCLSWILMGFISLVCLFFIRNKNATT